MRFNDNPDFYAEIARRVFLALCNFGIVNVPAIAGSLRRVHPTENVYDIERAVLGYANLIGAPILFEKPQSSEELASEDNQGLLVEFVGDDCEPLPD